MATQKRRNHGVPNSLRRQIRTAPVVPRAIISKPSPTMMRKPKNGMKGGG